MARKRPLSNRDRTEPRKRTKKALPLSPSSPDNDILALLYHYGSPASIDDLARELSNNLVKNKDIEAGLGSLLHEGLIRKTGKREYTINKHAPLYEGILEQNPRGFGFVTHCSSAVDAPPLKRDPFIAVSRMKLARQGDTVLIRVLQTRGDERPEAAIIKVIARGTDRLAGFFIRNKRGDHVIPEDIRYSFSVLVDARQFPEIENGDVVIVRIDENGEGYRNVSGEILEVLGPADNVDVQMQLVIEKFQLPHVFSEQTEKEAAALSENIVLEIDREDLRDIQHVTIDGETAKDFDDAIAVIKTRRGFRLYVSIADVSYFVPQGSATDQDAYARGTSIYFPGRVIPMLPEKLSNNLCSLVPDKDRLTLTAILDFDRKGTLKDKRLVRSIIRSRQRFTYTTVRKILIDKDQETRKAFKPFLVPLQWAEELARALWQKRRERGALGFTLPEPEIELADDGRIQSITRAERNFAHHLIEEFMLAANEAVALTFTEQQRAVLYRIHELPDPEKVQEFATFAATLGLNLPKVENSPHWFAGVLEACRSTPKEYIVNNLLLRTMQQARYSPKNTGHFGLAASDYTHFTSPIRRYPDLLVHREVCRILHHRSDKKPVRQEPVSLQEIGDYLSGRERTAIGAEREMNDRLKLLFMEKHIGESFDAIVSGVSASFLYIELLELFVSGTIAIEDIPDDYFFHDSLHHRIVGEISRRIYQIGNLLRVTLIDVDRSRNRINFKLPSGEEDQLG